ncbi:hypothetical protein F4818DRAFT_457149 [Hypoxylon cercidicola]|nr:hypothetical protein F4818DRAFT_457149 [Hypoxylon cercidicola]
MPLSSLASLFKLGIMTRERLFKNAKNLNLELDCITHYNALQQQGMYAHGSEYPLDLYKNGVQQRLENMVNTNHPQVHVLVLGDPERNHGASYAAEEFAKFLRAHRKEILVLRIYVQNRREPPETILVRLLASLIWCMISLVPDEFRTSDDLSRQRFKAFMECGPDCFGMGMRILGALPRLDFKGRKLFCIVDGLEHVEDKTTLEQVRELVRALRDIVAWNKGQLLYTFNKQSSIIQMATQC